MNPCQRLDSMSPKAHSNNAIAMTLILGFAYMAHAQPAAGLGIGERVSPTIMHPAKDDQNADLISDSLAIKLEEDLETHTLPIMMMTTTPVTDDDIRVFKALGGEIKHVFKHVAYGLAGTFPADQVSILADELKHSINVVRLDEDGVFDMDYSARQVRARPYGTCNSNTEFAWCYDNNAYRGDPNSSIAVAGSGVDIQHQDLGNGSWGTWNDPIVAWHDVTTGGGTPYDTSGHESLVTGIIVGQGNVNSEFVGIAPNSHVTAIRFGLATSDFLSACDWVLQTGPNPPALNRDEYGIKVFTVSWHYRDSNNSENDNGTVNAVETLVENGVLVTCSAGNNHDESSTYFDHYVGFPGQSQKVITVGATTTDSMGDGFRELMAGYSCNGDPNRPVKPDMVAPAGGCCPSGSTTGPNHSHNYIVQNFSDNCFITSDYESILRPNAGNRDVAFQFRTPPGGPFNIDVVAMAAQPPSIGASFELDVWFANDNQMQPGSMIGNQLDYSHETNDIPRYEPNGTLLLNGNTDYWLVASVPASSSSSEVRWYKNSDGELGGIAFNDGSGWVPLGGSLGGIRILLNSFVQHTMQHSRGTSFSTPYVAGGAALVIQALEANQGTWQYTEDEVMLVKSLLQLTATETTFAGENGTDCGGANNPQDAPVNRGGKDRSEGYGRLNVDAAVEAASQVWDLSDVGTYMGDFYETQKKCWARKVTFPASPSPQVVTLEVPGFADFDLFVYRETPAAFGEPVIVASSVTDSTENDENDEQITLCLREGGTYYIAVKWVEGAGTFNLTHGIVKQIHCPEQPNEPVSESSGSRAITVGDDSGTSDDSAGEAPIAYLVTSPDFLCLQSYVQLDGTLGNDPVFQAPSAWGVVTVTGAEIVPDTTYEIYADAGESGTPLLSDPTVVTTWAWGDTNNDGVANFSDILNVVLGFQGNFETITLEAVDLFPCVPNGIANFEDILQAVLAFQQQTYAETGCPLPCDP